MTSLLQTQDTKEVHLHQKGGFSVAVKRGRVIGSFLCLLAIYSAISLLCFILWGSQSANTALGTLLTTKRPLSPDKSFAGSDFCMVLRVHFMFHGLLRQAQTILLLLCLGLLGGRKGPRTRGVGSVTAAISVPYTATDLI